MEKWGLYLVLFIHVMVLMLGLTAVFLQAFDGNYVTDDTPGNVGVTDSEAKPWVESEGQIESAETEEHENKEANTEAGENSEAAEGDLPADEVRFVHTWCQHLSCFSVYLQKTAVQCGSGMFTYMFGCIHSCYSGQSDH